MVDVAPSENRAALAARGCDEPGLAAVAGVVVTGAGAGAAVTGAAAVKGATAVTGVVAGAAAAVAGAAAVVGERCLVAMFAPRRS